MKNKIYSTIIVFVILGSFTVLFAQKKVMVRATGFQDDTYVQHEAVEHYKQAQQKSKIFLDLADIRGWDVFVDIISSDTVSETWWEQSDQAIKENQNAQIKQEIIGGVGDFLSRKISRNYEVRNVGRRVTSIAQNSVRTNRQEVHRFKTHDFKVIIRIYEKNEIKTYYADGFLVLKEFQNPGSSRILNQIVECSPSLCGSPGSLLQIGDTFSNSELDEVRIQVFKKSAASNSRYLGGE